MTMAGSPRSISPNATCRLSGSSRSAAARLSGRPATVERCRTSWIGSDLTAPTMHSRCRAGEAAGVRQGNTPGASLAPNAEHGEGGPRSPPLQRGRSRRYARHPHGAMSKIFNDAGERPPCVIAASILITSTDNTANRPQSAARNPHRPAPARPRPGAADRFHSQRPRVTAERPFSHLKHDLKTPERLLRYQSAGRAGIRAQGDGFDVRNSNRSGPS